MLFRSQHPASKSSIQGGVNFLMQGAGWMEGGLHSSLEKFVLDADLLGMVSAYLDPIVVDEATLAHEAIGQVGPGGHYFGVQHTQDRFRDAFHKPMISDRRNYESWQEGGSPIAVTKTTELAHKWLVYQIPTMSSTVLKSFKNLGQDVWLKVAWQQIINGHICKLTTRYNFESS